MRDKFEACFKAKVTLEAYRSEKMLNELSAEYGAYPNQISKWKQELLAGVAGIFGSKKDNGVKKQEELAENLYKNIGELKVENDCLLLILC